MVRCGCRMRCSRSSARKYCAHSDSEAGYPPAVSKDEPDTQHEETLDEATDSDDATDAHDVKSDDVESGDVEDDASSPARSRRRFILPAFFAVSALVVVLLCLGKWASISYGFRGAFAGSTFHLYVNGFGALSTDLPGAGAAPGKGPSLVGWLMCGCAVVLLIAAVARALRPKLQRFLVLAIAAAVAQIAVAIYAATVVHGHVGTFYSQLDLNAKLMQAPATFAVGWAIWVELLLGFVILAAAVAALVKDRNNGIPLIRL